MMSNRSFDKRFHAIDIDPYGSASVFLNSAVQAVTDKGFSDLILFGHNSWCYWMKNSILGMPIAPHIFDTTKTCA